MITICIEYRDIKGDLEENVTKKLILDTAVMCHVLYIVQDANDNLVT